MEFNSPQYFLFLGLVLVLYYAGARTYRAQRLLIVGASLVFYAAWSPTFLLHFVAVATLNYAASLWMLATPSQRGRRLILGFAIAVDLVNLAVFKYSTLLVDSLLGLSGRLFGRSDFMTVPHLILPLAISFYTFHIISYLVDVYQQKPGARAASLLDFLFYVTLFPHQIAGPILRGHELFHQMRHQPPRAANLLQGFERVLLGLFQKAVIADNLAVIADYGFKHHAALSAGELYVVLIAYTFQIFCDFAGYSNMAIGSARMLGYVLPENFNNPYVVANISEFWRRWHMTLSRWIRDYIFIPLGGSQGSAWATSINLLITMGLAGLWHGASWTFLVWGLYHGAGLVVARAYAATGLRQRLMQGLSQPLYRLLAIVVTFHFVMLGWVLFRARDFTTAWDIYRQLAAGLTTLDAWYVAPAFLLKSYGFTALVLYGVYVLLARWHFSRQILQDGLRRGYLYAIVLYLVLLLAPVHTNPFIYFQF